MMVLLENPRSRHHMTVAGLGLSQPSLSTHSLPPHVLHVILVSCRQATAQGHGGMEPGCEDVEGMHSQVAAKGTVWLA